MSKADIAKEGGRKLEKHCKSYWFIGKFAKPIIVIMKFLKEFFILVREVGE